jgi:hypothetical protein
MGAQPQSATPLGPDAHVPGSATLTGKALGIGTGNGPFMAVGGIPMPQGWFRSPAMSQLLAAQPQPAPASVRQAPRSREDRVGGGGGGQARDNSRDRAAAGRGFRDGMAGRDRSNFGH